MGTQTRLPWKGGGQFTRTAVNTEHAASDYVLSISLSSLLRVGKDGRPTQFNTDIACGLKLTKICI
jgi:hypothetical protein